MLGTMYDVDVNVDDGNEGTGAEVKKSVSLGRLSSCQKVLKSLEMWSRCESAVLKKPA